MRLPVSAVLILVAGLVGSAGMSSQGPAAAAAEVDMLHVAATHRSGGEIAHVPGRDLVVTADRHNVGDAAALRPGLTVTDARRLQRTRTIGFWDLPWTAGAGGVPVPQVPSGLDVHDASGVAVTTNSAAGSVVVTHVDARAASPAGVVPVGPHPFGVEVDRAGRLAYVASYLGHRIDVVDVRARRVVGRIEGLRHPTKLALDETRGRLYVGNADRPPSTLHQLAVIDLASRTVVGAVPVDANSRPSVDPTTGVVYAASFATGRIAEIAPDDLASPRRVFETGSTPHGVGVDHRRGLLYAPNLLAGSVTVLDARRGETVATVPLEGVPLGVDIDDARGWAWISLRDRSELVALRVRR